MKTRIALLGSTGSIGTQTLDLVRWFPERLEVVALTARTDVDALRAQVNEFRPRYAAVTEPAPGADLRTSVGELKTGAGALVEAAALA
ncbi:MAG: 1-deoxy-D-xylulose-5-phosphate reductoisomerase, partial [Actinomycetota bacterium]